MAVRRSTRPPNTWDFGALAFPTPGGQILTLTGTPPPAAVAGAEVTDTANRLASMSRLATSTRRHARRAAATGPARIASVIEHDQHPPAS